jgi:hypothetical protein
MKKLEQHLLTPSTQHTNQQPNSHKIPLPTPSKLLGSSFTSLNQQPAFYMANTSDRTIAMIEWLRAEYGFKINYLLSSRLHLGLISLYSEMLKKYLTSIKLCKCTKIFNIKKWNILLIFQSTQVCFRDNMDGTSLLLAMQWTTLKVAWHRHLGLRWMEACYRWMVTVVGMT